MEDREVIGCEVTEDTVRCVLSGATPYDWQNPDSDMPAEWTFLLHAEDVALINPGVDTDVIAVIVRGGGALVMESFEELAASLHPDVWQIRLGQTTRDLNDLGDWMSLPPQEPLTAQDSAQIVEDFLASLGVSGDMPLVRVHLDEDDLWQLVQWLHGAGELEEAAQAAAALREALQGTAGSGEDRELTVTLEQRHAQAILDALEQRTDLTAAQLALPALEAALPA